MRYATTLQRADSAPGPLTPPGLGWEFVALTIRPSDGVLVVVWRPDA